MTGLTQAVDDLALEIGVAVNWTALHNHLNIPHVAALITAATTAASNTSLLQQHQHDINEALDAAKDELGLTEHEQLVAAALANMSLTALDERQAAVDRARTLIIPLTEIGVLEMPV